MSELSVYPFGGDGPRVTYDQAVSMANLGAIFIVKHELDASDNPDTIGWHTCPNGCCIVFHEPGMDEHAWFILKNGDVEKIDRYGNSIMYVLAEDLDAIEF